MAKIKSVKTQAEAEQFAKEYEEQLRDIFYSSCYEEVSDGPTRAIKDVMSVENVKIDKKWFSIIEDLVYWYY